MRLLDFFIRISLQGSDAARKLREIQQQAAKVKTTLNQAGAAATKAGTGINAMGRNAATANAKLLGLLRTSRMRFGFGGTVGGVALGTSGTLGGIAAAGLATGTVSRARTLQDERAGHALALGDLPYEEMKRAQADLIKQQERGLVRMVRGVNVLGRVSMTEIAQAQNAMLKAGFENGTKEFTQAVNAFTALKLVAGDEANLEDITKAVAFSGKIAADSGLDQMEASAMLVTAAANTTKEVDDVAKSIARFSGSARNAGISLEDWSTMLTATDDQFQTAVNAGNAFKNFIEMGQGVAKQKRFKALEAELNIDFFDDGKFKGFRSLAEQLRKIEKEKGSEFATEYMKSRFGRDGAKIARTFSKLSDTQIRALEVKAAAGSTRGIDNTLLEQYNTLTSAVAAFNAAWDKLASSLIKAGLLDSLSSIVLTVAEAFIWLADAIAANPEEFQMLGKAALWLLGAFVGLKILLGTWSIARMLTQFMRLGTIFRFIWTLGKILLRYVIMPLLTGLAALLGLPVWVVAAIAAAIAAVAYVIYSYWDEIKAGAASAWEYLKRKGAEFWAYLSGLFTTGKEYLVGVWNSLWEGIKSVAIGAVNAVTEFVSGLIDKIAEAMQGLVGLADQVGGFKTLATPFGANAMLAGAAVDAYRGAQTTTVNNNQRYTGVPTREIEKATRQSGQRRARGARTTREGKR